jgi:hypothetical protein
MRLPRPLLRTILPCAILLAVTASLAAAAHVPGVLPLTSSSNHSNEKFNGVAFPAGNYSNYDFAGADLTNCTFSPGSNLTGAIFWGAKLQNTNFSGCTLDLASFAGADLSFAVLPCMGGANFRGAILTGVNAGGTGCAGCVNFGPNVTDACTVNPGVNLCTGAGTVRGLVSAVVFIDQNTNGQLDLGEQGVPGATVIVSLTSGGGSGPTDANGGFFLISPGAGTGGISVTLPAGYIHTGPGSQSLNLAICRSGQALIFPVSTPPVPAIRSTFGRVKAIYR